MQLEEIEAERAEPYIITCTGKRFHFRHPEDFRYTVDDIAPALGKMNRFTCHTSRFLSVAEHAVLVSYLVPPEHAFAALHHDDVEAFIGDHSSPLKKFMPQLRELARVIEPHIAAAIGFEYPFSPAIHKADQWALGRESEVAMFGGVRLRDYPARVADFEVHCAEWWQAERAYRRRHEELLRGAA